MKSKTHEKDAQRIRREMIKKNPSLENTLDSIHREFLAQIGYIRFLSEVDMEGLSIEIYGNTLTSSQLKFIRDMEIVRGNLYWDGLGTTGKGFKSLRQLFRK